MRHPLLIAVLLPTSLWSQWTPVTTFYVIPPVNVCDGVWAIDHGPGSPCASVAAYNTSPMGCADFANVTTNTVDITIGNQRTKCLRLGFLNGNDHISTAQ